MTKEHKPSGERTYQAPNKMNEKKRDPHQARHIIVKFLNGKIEII